MSGPRKSLSEIQHNNRHTHRKSAHRDSNLTGRDSLTLAEATNDLRDVVPAAAHTRNVTAVTHSLPSKVWGQIISFNPLRSSFLELYFDLEHRYDKAVAILGGVLAIAAGVPLPIIFVVFSKIIDSFPPTEDDLRMRLSQLLGVAAAYFVVTTGYTCAFSRVGERIAFTSRERLLKCLLELEQEYFDTHDIDVTGLLTSKIETIQVGTSEKAGIFLQSISYFVAAFIVGFILNAKLTGILLAAVIPLTVVIVGLGSRWITELSKAASSSNEAASGLAEASLRAIRVVQAFDVCEAICKQYLSHLNAATVKLVKKQIVSACMLGCIYFVAYAANGLAFYVGSVLSASDNAQAGTIYAVCLLILDASFIVGQFAPFLNIFANAASAGEEIRELVKLSRETLEAASLQGTREAVDIRGLPVEAKEVSFAYPARADQSVLDEVNIKFEPACLNAVVGTSGGGKSTLVSLLLGIYKDYTGTVLLGDKDLQSINVANLRSQISIVDQECVLFTGSVFDNICYGLAGVEHKKEDLRARCDEATAAAGVDFLDRLPKGLDTIIDNSLQLSGGQKQRICLARALMKRPAILILDEPTSALDARSEALVAKTVKRVAEGGTLVIMIAHRLSTVLDADKVFVFDAGKVAESGSPAELINPGTIFYNLLSSQYSGDVPSEADLKNNVDVKAEELSTTTLDDDSDDEFELELQRTASKTPGSGPRQRLRTVLKPERLFVATGLLFSTITGCIIIGEAISFGNLVELLNAGGSSGLARSGINFYCLIFFILACIALVTYSASGSAFGVASSRFTKRVQVRMLRNLLRQDIVWFTKSGRSVHELMARLSTDTGNLSSLSGVALGTIFTITASMTSGIVLSFAVAWRIAAVLISCVPVLAAAGYTRVRILAKSEENQRNAYNEAAGIASESCRNIRTVTTLGLEEIVLQRYHTALAKPYKHRLKFTLAANALLAFSFAITYFVYALAYWWGAKNVREGYYGSKQFFIVLPALLFSAQSAGQAFSLSPEITKAKSAARSVSALLNAQPTILKELMASKEMESETTIDTKEKFKAVPKIEFKEVTMCYKHNDESPALRNASFQLEAGSTCALVGPSGAGKSTVVSLLERFYEVSAGAVLVDGTDIKEHDPRKLRARIGLVPQEPHFFPGSIRHNLTMSGVQNGDMTSQIEHACASVGLHEFITSLPEGYDTECSSASSTKLSGGQQQRLAIARALVRDPEILLLDEPTSALDAHSEREVQEALNAAATGRTTLIVAHRLSSIKHVDRIIVFDRGRIAEIGTHAELMQSNGLYASMAKAQSLS